MSAVNLKLRELVDEIAKSNTTAVGSVFDMLVIAKTLLASSIVTLSANSKIDKADVSADILNDVIEDVTKAVRENVSHTKINFKPRLTH